jgi:hypothetical protein
MEFISIQLDEGVRESLFQVGLISWSEIFSKWATKKTELESFHSLSAPIYDHVRLPIVWFYTSRLGLPNSIAHRYCFLHSLSVNRKW